MLNFTEALIQLNIELQFTIRTYLLIINLSNQEKKFSGTKMPFICHSLKEMSKVREMM